MGSLSNEYVKMLVLETDDPHPDTLQEKGSFGEIFHSLFTEAGDKHDPPLKVDTDMHFVVDDPENDKNGHVPKLDEVPESIDAVLVTGSMYDAHSDEKWTLELLELLTSLWKSRPHMKFSGVCFGHQILSRMLGAQIEQTPGGKWELAHTEMDLTTVGQRLFRTSDSILNLHQMHQDQVTTVPSPEISGLVPKDRKVHVWASTPHTEIQGLYIRDRLFTSQGHLGFDEKMVRRQIEMREEVGSIEESETAARGKEKAHLKHDGLIVAAAIVRFFHGDDHDID